MECKKRKLSKPKRYTYDVGVGVYGVPIGWECGAFGTLGKGEVGSEKSYVVLHVSINDFPSTCEVTEDGDDKIIYTINHEAEENVTFQFIFNKSCDEIILRDLNNANNRDIKLTKEELLEFFDFIKCGYTTGLHSHKYDSKKFIYYGLVLKYTDDTELEIRYEKKEDGTLKLWRSCDEPELQLFIKYSDTLYKIAKNIVY
jgi:hypothetical protein